MKLPRSKVGIVISLIYTIPALVYVILVTLTLWSDVWPVHIEFVSCEKFTCLGPAYATALPWYFLIGLIPGAWNYALVIMPVLVAINGVILYFIGFAIETLYQKILPKY